MADESPKDLTAVNAESNNQTQTQTPKTLRLVSSNKVEFVVLSSHASRSETIKNLIEDLTDSDLVVPLHIVSSDALRKITEYWKHTDVTDESSSSSSSSVKMSEWEKEFVKMERDELFEVLSAANYLSEKTLLGLLCQAVADNIKNMTVEQCREYMGIENDFTPEEEKKVREEYDWAFT